MCKWAALAAAEDMMILQVYLMFPNLPGVGISFGVDRIYDVMEELKLFPESVQTTTKVLFFNLGEAAVKTAYKLLQQLRR